MNEKHLTRIDKWLWAVRIFKTRSIASNACAKGKIKIDGIAVKASRNIKINDLIEVRKGIITYLFKVKKIADKRMNAKLASDFTENLTSQDELNKLISIPSNFYGYREKGKGRPTKKERRLIDKYKNN
tara:strand:+ start:51 stop:434 length:384 start_codon:yes stop_codon:yes gene_type:complete